MISHESVELVLDRVRPYSIADGGNVELVDIAANDARICLTGMCAGYPSSHRTLRFAIEPALRASTADSGFASVSPRPAPGTPTSSHPVVRIHPRRLV